MGMTLTQYQEAIVKLLPRGAAWAGENLRKLVKAFAAECQRADLAIEDLWTEALPSTTDDCIPDWERVLGLPDAYNPVVGATDAQRRQMIVAKLAATGGQSKAYFEGLAAQIGFTATIFDQYRPFVAGSRAGDRDMGTDWRFVYHVTVSGVSHSEWLQVFSILGPAHCYPLIVEA